MEHIVDKQTMDALRVLAETNLKVSEAKATLQSLQETETEYLVSREKRVMDRITDVLKESQDLLNETKANTDEVERFHKTVSAFSDSLKEVYEKFHENVVLFDEKSLAWGASVERQEAEIAQMKQVLDVDRVKIANDKKNIEIARKRLEEDTKKLASDRGALERAIERLKNNRI